MEHYRIRGSGMRPRSTSNETVPPTNPEEISTDSDEVNDSSMELLRRPSQAEKFTNCLIQAISEIGQQLKASVQKVTCFNNNDTENVVSSSIFTRQAQSSLYTNLSSCLLAFKRIVLNNEHIFFEAAYGICGYTGANIANKKLSDEKFNLIAQIGMQITCAAGAYDYSFYSVYHLRQAH